MTTSLPVAGAWCSACGSTLGDSQRAQQRPLPPRERELVRRAPRPLLLPLLCRLTEAGAAAGQQPGAPPPPPSSDRIDGSHMPNEVRRVPPVRSGTQSPPSPPPVALSTASTARRSTAPDGPQRSRATSPWTGGVHPSHGGENCGMRWCGWPGGWRYCDGSPRRKPSAWNRSRPAQKASSQKLSGSSSPLAKKAPTCITHTAGRRRRQ